MVVGVCIQNWMRVSSMEAEQDAMHLEQVRVSTMDSVKQTVQLQTDSRASVLLDTLENTAKLVRLSYTTYKMCGKCLFKISFDITEKVFKVPSY